MKLVLITSMILLSGCGAFKRTLSSVTGDPTEYCHKGVSYLQFPSGATVAYEPSGNVVTCK